MTQNDWAKRQVDGDLSLRSAKVMHHDHCTVDVLSEAVAWDGDSTVSHLHPFDLERFILYAEGEGWDFLQLVTSEAVNGGRPLAILRKKPAWRTRDDSGALSRL